MFNLTKLIFNFIGALFIIKAAFIGWIGFALFIFMFGGRPSVKVYQDLSIVEKAQVNLVDNLRHNVRVVYGLVIPLKQSYFINITENQKKTLPSSNKSLFKINKIQDNAMKDLGRKMTHLDFLLRKGQNKATREIASKIKDFKFSSSKN